VSSAPSGRASIIAAALAEGLPVSTEIGDRWVVQIGLSGCAGLAARTGRPRLALRLFRYGTMSHPIKRRVRDIVIPALARSAVIQRLAARKLTHVYVTYPPGPLVRPDRARGGPRPGQRMPDMNVRAGGRITTLHSVLRGGRHVLLVLLAEEASVLREAGLRPYREEFDVVTGEWTGFRDNRTKPVVLVRPDGHAAARGRPGSMHAITGYLRGLFGQPASPPDDRLLAAPARSGAPT
jgi:hypothetical protein